MRLLIVTAVEAEARAIGPIEDARVIVAGIGRTNAAAATTEALVRGSGSVPRYDAVISAGIAGALPGSGLSIGDAVVASSCVYVEEGIVTRHGFAGMESLGFPLGDFAGNAVPVDPGLLDRLCGEFTVGPIATVATCSGADAAALEVRRRTAALAEAMEGAAVVHAARRLNVPAIELRAISNSTGDRASQQWDLKAGLTSLGQNMIRAVASLRA